MSAPTVTPTTERVYGLLPALYRDGDAATDPPLPPNPGPRLGGAPLWLGSWATLGLPPLPFGPTTPGVRTANAQAWPLLRYLSLLGDQADTLAVLFDRLNYLPPEEGPGRRSSDLVDPATADLGWLPWLGLLVGARVDPAWPESVQRAAVAGAAAGWAAGTAESMAVAARSALTGSKHCVIVPFYGGSPWLIGVQTLSTETPDDAAVLAAIVAADAKPAGYLLVVSHYAASWDTIEAHYPTWDALEAAGSWDVIESTLP